MRKYFTLFLLCLLPLALSAQSGVSTSLFTGRMSYTIPIYTIEDPDFNLDIALRYSSEGFKPFQPSGCYGQDWTLVAGGCITRQVMGIPDEWEYYHYGCDDGLKPVNDYRNGQDGYAASYWVIGFKHAREICENEENNAYPFLDKDLIFNFDASIYSPDKGGVYTGCTPKSDKVDLMPDIFYFNFCGYSGSFIMNNSGKVVILSGDYVKVEMSAFFDKADDLAHLTCKPTPTKITIKTTDGYTYVFGGDGKSIEYSVASSKKSDPIQDSPYTTAWHITQIIAPNGRQLSFEYLHDSRDDYDWSLKSFITDYDWTEAEKDSTHIVYSFQKECLLKSIATSDSIPLEITFESQQEEHKMYDYPEFGPYNRNVPHLQLNSVVVKCGGRELKRATLSYMYRSCRNMTYAYGAQTNDFYWRYLSAVTISGVGKYTMSYADIDPYEQENQSNAQLIAHSLIHYPSLNPITADAYKKMVDRFGFWKVTSIAPLQGMLTKVSLPTGGFVEFRYGTHDYSTERRFRIFSSVSKTDLIYEPKSYADQPIGGVRIEMIKMRSEPSKVVETKTFTYKKSGKSTGVFYNIYEIYDDIANKRMAVANPYNYNMISSHIGYSYVEKETIIGTDKSKTTYSFDTGNQTFNTYSNSTINRRYDIKEQKRELKIFVEEYDREKELCSGSLTHDPFLIRPGKLIKTESFEGDKLIKLIQYTYNNGATNNIPGGLGKKNIFGCTDTIVILSIYSAHTARKLYVCPDVLEKVIAKEYVGDQVMETVQEYRYDSKLRKKTETVTDSRGRQLFTKYTYPDEFLKSLNPLETPLWWLIKDNRIGAPVETVSGYTENGTEYITSGSINLYTNKTYIEVTPGVRRAPSASNPNVSQFNGGNIDGHIDTNNQLGTMSSYPCLSKTLALAISSPMPIANYQSLKIDGSSTSYDPNYTLVAEYDYDWMNRLLSMKPFGKMETKYTWKGIYPVTKTIGNQTWKYEYIPYVGIKSMTDPRGNTVYYEYDANGRLVKEYIKDEKGNDQILNVYQYHIKTE